RERDEIRDMRPDWRPPLEAASSKPPVVDQRVPQFALAFGRIAPQEPGKATDRRAPASGARHAALIEHGAQQFGLFAIEHAATGRTFAALRQSHDDAV